MPMSTYLITGATSGLGYQVAWSLAQEGGQRLILPVRDTVRGAVLCRELMACGAEQVMTPMMDLASLRSVAAFLHAFNSEGDAKLDGVLMNAGVQSAKRLAFTPDGLESTFAVNHLAHHMLIKGLLHRLSDRAVVGWTASGTHDPSEVAARLSGFRGARYTSLASLAHGECESGTSAAQACRDAYATSKLCNIVSARVFAQTCAKTHAKAATFFSFDPGLMAGTGLAREQGPVALWVWRHVLPRMAALLPGTSTPQRSAAVLTALLTGRLAVQESGAYFNYTGRPLAPAAPAREPWVAEDLIKGSDLLIAHIDGRRQA